MNSVLIFVAFCLQSADAFFGPTLFPLPSCCSVPAKGSSLQMRVQSTSAISKKNILAGAALLSFAVSPAQPSRALQLNTAAGKGTACGGCLVGMIPTMSRNCRCFTAKHPTFVHQQVE
jgi:hypothetical protein